jgi:4-alpha-glucanotransferase
VFRDEAVDYGAVIAYKRPLLRSAADRFFQRGADKWEREFRAFRRRHKSWLEEYALFSALKDEAGGGPWYSWQEDVAFRRPEALRSARVRLSREISREQFLQFVFDRQWRAVRQAARQRGITLIGDLPIYVAHDSADVWANPELFQLDKRGALTAQAGVPPDAFTETGQLWGNPLYRWRKMRSDGYAWWIRRVRRTLELVDVVRLDHFLGFHAYWEVPSGAPTAQGGRWVRGPGVGFFRTLESALGGLPILAEDLGVISRAVVELRDQFRLPGMKILQFAFGEDADHEFLPHNYPVRCAVYTGTHDNDTARGWYEKAPEPERHFCRLYLGVDGHDIAWDLIRAAWSSVAEAALAPLQDFLSLGSEARMNFPGRPDGNWTWRARADQLNPQVAARLAELNRVYGRESGSKDESGKGSERGAP